MPHTTYSKNHLPISTHFRLTESAALYLAHTIRTLALSLIGIYLPIYIFTLPNKFLFGTDPFLSGLDWVLFYFLIRSLAVLLGISFLSNLIFSKLNFKGSIFLSSALQIVQVSLWFLAGNMPVLIFLAAFAGGLVTCFYWVPYHILFVRKTGQRDGHFGRETSLRIFLVRLANIVGPLLGGLMIAFWGFNLLFGLSILLLIVATLPIVVSMRENHHHKHNVWQVIKSYLINPKFKKLSLAFAGSGMDTVVYAVFWPILMFVVLQNFVKIGVISSLSLLASALTVLWVGKALDRYGAKLVHGTGVLVNSLLYLPRVFLSSASLIYAIDILDRLNSAFYGVPQITEVYEKAKRLQAESDFIVYREITLHLAIIMTVVMVILVLPVLGSWQWIFVLAAIGSALTYFLTLDRN